MPVFNVSVTGDDLEQASEILHAATGVSVLGPVGGEIVAAVDAETADGARARVRDLLPGNYTVGETSPQA
jgi:hypothetical protein